MLVDNVQLLDDNVHAVEQPVQMLLVDNVQLLTAQDAG